MKKFRSFQMILAVATTMAASLLSAATGRADELTDGADTDTAALSSIADAPSDTEGASASTDSVETGAAENTAGISASVAPDASEATAEEGDSVSSSEAADEKAENTEGKTDASEDEEAGLSLSIGKANIGIRIYGFLNAQLEMVQATGGVTPYALRGRISDGNSRIGFSGQVELADGLEAIWQLEAGLGGFEQGGLNDRGLLSALESRNTFVGVNYDKVGRLIFGHNDSVYRSMVGSAGAFGGSYGLIATGLDLWNNTTAQMSGNPNSLFGRGESRMVNSLHYTTPLFHGLQLGGSFSFDESAKLARFRNRASAALTYEIGGFKIGGGYDYHQNTGVDQLALYEGRAFSFGEADDVDTSFVKGLAGYVHDKNKDFRTSVSAGVEYAMYGYSSFLYVNGRDALPELTEGTMKQLGFMASASQGISHGLTLMVSGGMLLGLQDAVIGEAEDYEAWQVSGGIKYMLGKNFATYIYFTHISNSSRQNVNFGQAPVYSNNLGTTDAYLAPGNDPQSLGLGVLARF